MSLIFTWRTNELLIEIKNSEYRNEFIVLFSKIINGEKRGEKMEKHLSFDFVNGRVLSLNYITV